MVEWNERRLKKLVRKMGLELAPEQGEEVPIHLSLYGPFWKPEPLLTKIMRLDADQWAALGYDETDRVSVTRYLGGLGCRTDDALSAAAYFQQPLTPELAKLLIDAGAFNKEALSYAAQYQNPLTFELAKLLIDVGCDSAAQDSGGWDALVFLAAGDSPVDPQVTDLFLSCGCRRNLDGCKDISNKHRLRFDQILQEHAQWKAKKLDQECVPANGSCDLNWGW